MVFCTSVAIQVPFHATETSSLSETPSDGPVADQTVAVVSVLTIIVPTLYEPTATHLVPSEASAFTLVSKLDPSTEYHEDGSGPELI